LKEIRADLKHGVTVKAGEAVAKMGRTTNTREGISRERAHLHFELDLVVNERFPAWYAKTYPGQRNDHGGWNGQNLVGLDPRVILTEAQKAGGKFSLVEHLRQQTELCRVFVRDTNFSWLKRYPALVKANPTATKEGIAGYEIALNYCGLPYELIPRAASEVKSKSSVVLLSVNAAEQQKHPCRKLVTRDKRGQWQLGNAGQHLMSLLVY
jgi:peptidoglycan LD-endopeptidase LytH